MKRIIAIILIPVVFSFSSCAWWQKPDTQSAVVTATQAIVSYAEGNTPSTVVNTLSTAASLMRSFQSTPKAAQPAAIQSAVVVAGASKLAPVIANAVTALTANGVLPDKANENIASLLDTVVANKLKTAP